MAHKVIVPQKIMSRSFLNSGTLIVTLVFQNIDPHPPLRPASVSSPRNKGTHSPGGEGDGGVNILEDERNRVALLQL